MEYKQGMGWKACYDEERELYTAQRSGAGYYQLYEITKEIYEALADGMSDLDSLHLIDKGRELYMDVDDRCGPPYTVILDHDYAKLCPWANVVASEHVWPDELTDAAVEIFESQKNSREQRRKKREERERKSEEQTHSTSFFRGAFANDPLHQRLGVCLRCRSVTCNRDGSI